jgi:hypothetical protein
MATSPPIVSQCIRSMLKILAIVIILPCLSAYGQELPQVKTHMIKILINGIHGETLLEILASDPMLSKIKMHIWNNWKPLSLREAPYAQIPAATISFLVRQADGFWIKEGESFYVYRKEGGKALAEELILQFKPPTSINPIPPVGVRHDQNEPATKRGNGKNSGNP